MIVKTIVKSILSGVVISGQVLLRIVSCSYREMHLQALVVPDIIGESGARPSFTRNSILKTIDTINGRTGFYF